MGKLVKRRKRIVFGIVLGDNCIEPSVELDGLSRCGFTGERALLVAMLTRSILDLRSDNTIWKREATRFFLSDSYEPFSYLWVCDHLDLCQKRLKREIRKEFEL